MLGPLLLAPFLVATGDPVPSTASLAPRSPLAAGASTVSVGYGFLTGKSSTCDNLLNHSYNLHSLATTATLALHEACPLVAVDASNDTLASPNPRDGFLAGCFAPRPPGLPPEWLWLSRYLIDIYNELALGIAFDFGVENLFLSIGTSLHALGAALLSLGNGKPACKSGAENWSSLVRAGRRWGGKARPRGPSAPRRVSFFSTPVGVYLLLLTLGLLFILGTALCSPLASLCLLYSTSTLYFAWLLMSAALLAASIDVFSYGVGPLSRLLLAAPSIVVLAIMPSLPGRTAALAASLFATVFLILAARSIAALLRLAALSALVLACYPLIYAASALRLLSGALLCAASRAAIVLLLLLASTLGRAQARYARLSMRVRRILASPLERAALYAQAPDLRSKEWWLAHDRHSLLSYPCDRPEDRADRRARRKKLSWMLDEDFGAPRPSRYLVALAGCAERAWYVFDAVALLTTGSADALVHRAVLLAASAYSTLAPRYARFATLDYWCRYLDTLLSLWRPLASTRAVLLTFLVLGFSSAHAGDDDAPAGSSRPPLFNGTRTAFMPWFMAFSGWVAWRLTEAAEILDETSARPTPVAPTGSSTGNADLVKAWDDGNKKLYGALMQAMPAWLCTSLFNDHKNDGLAAVKFLRDSFDSKDENDHAAQLARLQAHYIDPRNDMSEDDLRHQFDAMAVAKAGIIRAGGTAPADATLIAMFDNSLPLSYSNVRQLVRRAKHGTFINHYNDYMAQVRAELGARAPVAQAFNAHADPAGFIPRPPTATPGGGGGGGGGGGDGGGDGGGGGGGGSGQYPANPCLNCGEPGHTRPNCKKRKARCPTCRGPHLGAFCPKGRGGARRNALGEAAKRLLQQDVERAAAARGAGSALAASSPAPAPASAPAPTPAPAPAAAAQPGPSDASAHQAAAAAAAAHNDPDAAARAYVAALRALGYGMCVPARPPPPLQSLVGGARAPKGSHLVAALVDSMATFWVVNDPALLHRVTNSAPGFSIATADGAVAVDAVGTALVWLMAHDRQWLCFEVPNVLLMRGCPSILYSTRVMRDAHGLAHDVDAGRITVPARGSARATHVPITDDGSSFAIPVAFVPRGAAPPACTRAAPSPLRQVHAAAALSPATYAATTGTTQATLYHRLGFPYENQWRHVPVATANHGLPPNTVPSTTIPVRDEVVRGRARALPFASDGTKERPPPGSTFFGDFAGPMIASHPHRFTCYSGWVDGGSSYGRAFPAHGMTAAMATATLGVFTADVAAKMGLSYQFKPLVVRTDQGSAYTSGHFAEFLSLQQVQRSLAAPYTPQQNSMVERFWGIAFGTARVLLAAANLPPSFHPFAIQTAVWLANRLPRASLGNQSPFFVLTRRLPDLSYLHCFGCLCAVTLPDARRDGDRHFADRGQYALYLGPSEESPAHVVYVLSSRKVHTVAHIRVWEDRFPGVRGETFDWFPPDALADGAAGAAPSAAAPLPAAAAPVAPATPASDAPAGAAPSLPSDASTVLETPSSTGSPAGRAPPPLPASPAQEGMPFPSLESHASTQHPQAHDPSSRHFARQHPSRVRQQPSRLEPRLAGKSHAVLASRPVLNAAAYSAAVVSFAMLAATCAIAPAFAFVSCLAPTDDAFSGYSDGDEGRLLAACGAAFSCYALAVAITADHGHVPVPRGYRQALDSEHASYWREAINKELSGLLERQVWTLVLASSMPSGSNLMNCHYVFAVKRLADGSVEKFKARLVADGNTQKYGVDFNRVFATVVKPTTLRLLLVLAAARDYNLHQVDITQAYLQAALDTDLYMRCPPGVHPFDAQGRPLVCKLQRSLYGLRQAGREWAAVLSAFLVEWGLSRSTIDTCLYIYTHGASALWVCVYVDDICLADNDDALRERFMSALSERFPTEDKGELQWLLGIGVHRDRAARSLELSQELYIADIVTRWASYIGAGHTRRYDSPMEEGLLLTVADCPTRGSPEWEAMADRRAAYMAIVGSLNWLANMTFAEIAYATSQLSRFLDNPGPKHFDAAIRVLIYLDGHRDRRLVMKPNASLGLEVFVDSSWATKFSCSGAYFFVYGCVVFWFSKMQKSVALSTAEAEYFGAMLAAKEAIFLRELLIEFGIHPDGPTTIFSDSDSAVDMSLDPVSFRQTKHILRAAEFLRDLVARRVVRMQHLPGRVMVADLLTKALPRAVFTTLVGLVVAYAAERQVVLPDAAVRRG